MIRIAQTTLYILTAVTVVVVATQASNGKYIAEGTIQGFVCTNYLIFSSCRLVELAAVEGEDGRLYTISEEYETVSEFNERASRCWIRIRSEGWISWALNRVMGPRFFVLNDNDQLQLVSPESITFRCRKDG